MTFTLFAAMKTKSLKQSTFILLDGKIKFCATISYPQFVGMSIFSIVLKFN